MAADGRNCAKHTKNAQDLADKIATELRKEVHAERMKSRHLFRAARRFQIYSVFELS